MAPVKDNDKDEMNRYYDLGFSRLRALSAPFVSHQWPAEGSCQALPTATLDFSSLDSCMRRSRKLVVRTAGVATLLVTASIALGWSRSLPVDLASSSGAETSVNTVSAVVKKATRAPRKISLLIGISDYQHFGAATQPLSDLQGPENDVKRLQVSLNRWGFGTSEDTKVLLGASATKEGIASGFKWLAKRALSADDAVVIYFSGHGSHAPDGPDDDEPDGRDEGLVPFDAEDVHNPSQLVLDDDIREYLKALGTENVTIIIDACYSGTVTRGEGDAVGRDKGPKPDTSFRPDTIGFADFTEARGHTLITAARSDQVAQELPYDEGGTRVWIGAMTYHLTRALDGAAGTRGLRYDELIQRLKSNVRGAMLPQIPQLEGDQTALIFRSNQGVAARPFVTAREVAGRLVLDAGAIHGVRKTANYEVYRSGEVQFTTVPIARIRVDSVVAEQSFGVYVDAQGNVLGAAGSSFTKPTLPDGARAVLSRVPLGANRVDRLRIYFAKGAATLADSVQNDSSRFVIVDSASADAIVTLQRGVAQVYVNGIPLAPQTDEAVRVDSLVGYRGTELCRPLIRALSITAMNGIENPTPPADLTLDVHLVPAGTGAPRGVRAAGVPDSVVLGKRYDVYARANARAQIAEISTLYMTLAIGGYTSDPFVLWPQEGDAHSPITLNTWIQVGFDIPMLEPIGSEMLKMVVGSDQFSLQPLVESFGICGAIRGDPPAKWRSNPKAIVGWTTLSHRINIYDTLPKKK